MSKISGIKLLLSFTQQLNSLHVELATAVKERAVVSSAETERIRKASSPSRATLVATQKSLTRGKHTKP